MRIGFAITRAAAVDATWTTVSLITAALERGWTCDVIEPWDWQVDPGQGLCARAHHFDAPMASEEVARALAHRLAHRTWLPLAQLDLLLLRASPLNTTLMAFALLAQQQGIRVVNDPRGLLAVSHKSWLAGQRGVQTPPSVVTRSRAAAHLFLTEQPDGVVVKPARGSGGRAVSRVAPYAADQLDIAFDRAAAHGEGHVVVQQWLPESAHGEKRLIWLDGDLLGGYLRQRAPGEFRHNLKRGGVPCATGITDAEREAVHSLTPALRATGIRLAGLDLIGAWITEVNALNPGGVHHADRLHGTRLSVQILDRLAGPPEPRHTWAPPVH